MNKSLLTVGILLYKETRYLKWMIPSLLSQITPDMELILRDQSPNGEVYDHLKENYPGLFERATVTKGTNLMHSGGHNEIIRKASGSFYVCGSQDMYYPPSFFKELKKHLIDSSINVASCKLMQWNIEKITSDSLSPSLSSTIDSYGIGLTEGHQFIELGRGADKSDYNEELKILGPSGALGIYSLKALGAIAYKNANDKPEYFDTAMHYKNDCDLAYRLTSAGYKTKLIDLKAYHARQVTSKKMTWLSRLLSHSKKSIWNKESSLFGHLYCIKKNSREDYSLRIKLKTAFFSVFRFLHTLTTHPSLLSSYTKISVLKGDIILKRKSMNLSAPSSEIEALMYKK